MKIASVIYAIQPKERITIVRTCLECPPEKYMDCPRRRSRMKKVKAQHGTNRREDIRFRIAAMEWIAEGCDVYHE